MYELGQSNKKIDALYGDIDINLQRIIRLEHQLEELNSAFENSENSFVSGNIPVELFLVVMHLKIQIMKIIQKN